MQTLVYPEESYAIMGAAFEVYKQLGCGFLEAVYQEALLLELGERGIPYESPKPLKLHYKGNRLTQEYFADVACFDKILLELKAVAHLVEAHEAQLHNYLKATGMKLGILLNFGHHPKLEYKRIAM
jgi:GxxExxY protein